MPKIYAPNRTFNGTVAGVAFANGVADVTAKEHPQAMAYFERKGYGIGKHAKDPETSAPEWDARDVERTGPHRFGTPLRDAAVDPRPEDFLPPTNAGKADPHGPHVVAPEIHASGPKGIKPGDVHVGEPDAQQAAETSLAEAVLVEGGEHPAQPDDGDVDRGELGLSDPGSVAMGAEGAAEVRAAREAAAEAAGEGETPVVVAPAEDTRTVKELQAAAKAAGKTGFSRMNRDELLALLGGS